jgi:hypothetical protein
MRVQDMEGYDEVVQQMLARLSLKDRLYILGLTHPPPLAGFTQEKRQAFEEFVEPLRKALKDLPLERRLRIASLSLGEHLVGLLLQPKLAVLDPEQAMQKLLAGLAPEQAILALPDEVLRGFSEDYLATLSEPTRAAIRSRLQR